MIGIIGGTGFIGLNLASHLQMRGVACRTFSRHGLLPIENGSYLSRLNQIEHIKGDIRNKAAVDEFVRSCRCVVAVVSHLLPASSAEEMKVVTSWFTPAFAETLEACRANDVEQLIFVSSGGTIYGENPDCVPVGEEHPLNAQSGYGSFCALLEQLLQAFYHERDQPFTILRVANPYGPLKRPDKKQGLIDHFIRSARAREPFTIFGDGSEVRDYIYIDDVSEAIARVLASPARNSIFNVGTGVGHTSSEVIQAVTRRFDLPEVPLHFKPRRPGDVRCSLLDMAKFENVYGIRCDTTLREGLDKYASNSQQTPRIDSGPRAFSSNPTPRREK